MQDDSKVTVIIPNYNGRKFMDQCMDALAKQTYTDFVVLIVDNGSADGSVEYLRDLVSEQRYPFPVRTILLKENTGFSGAVNVGISAASTPCVVLLNNDTEAQPGYLEALVQALEEDGNEERAAGPGAMGCDAAIGNAAGNLGSSEAGSANSAANDAVSSGTNSAAGGNTAGNLGSRKGGKANSAANRKSPRIFAVSPKMVQLYHQDLLDDAGDGYNLLGWAFQRGVGQPVETPKFTRRTNIFSACAGAAIYRRDILEEIRLDRIQQLRKAVPDTADDRKTPASDSAGEIGAVRTIKTPKAVKAAEETPTEQKTGSAEAAGAAERTLTAQAVSADNAVSIGILAYEDLDGRRWPAGPYFDPLHFAYLEDLDVCFRARVRGYRVLYEPAAVVHHVGSGTSGSRYNPFKVRLAARNNIYLNYKNMPLLMLLLNLPGILAGVLIKQCFFIRIGFGRDYCRGFFEGLTTIPQCRPHKTRFVPGRLVNYVVIECLLIRDTFSYIQDFVVRQAAKLRRKHSQAD